MLIAGPSDVSDIAPFTKVAQPIAARVIENENAVVAVVLRFRADNRALQDGLLLIVSGYQQIDAPAAGPHPGAIARGLCSAIDRPRQEDEQQHAADGTEDFEAKEKVGPDGVKTERKRWQRFAHAPHDRTSDQENARKARQKPARGGISIQRWPPDNEAADDEQHRTYGSCIGIGH